MIKIALISLLVVLTSVLYVPVKNLVTVGGVFKNHINNNTATCRSLSKDSLLRGCENGQLHPGSGIIFYACAFNTEERDAWFPPADHLNRSVIAHGGIVAFDPKTETAIKLEIDSNVLTITDGFAPHGMGIFEDPSDPSTIYIHAVNHRRAGGSCIEIFKHTLGAPNLHHIETASNPAMLYHPNDVQPVGPRSFYASNDLGSRSYFLRKIEGLMGLRWGHVVYYHDGEWSISAKDVAYPNGIAVSKNLELVYVSSTSSAEILVFKRRPVSGSLRLVDQIKLPAIPDNISVDSETGALYVAAISGCIQFLYHVEDHSVAVPGMVLKISPNENTDKFYGKKFNVDVVMEWDGALISGATCATYDHSTSKMVIGSLYSGGVVVCDKVA
ncbi:hypothetical protein BASA50_006887 [Batrachochytrium salamandrivorans]|uniref:SMP-30/Gluconolactonase/LRE-like region domain-containing protein n=1 Tax=Batrachochytrium salamandrivorans TaxID=1357716 RepID=A0ABQ8FBF5_9FUNG|nr:hypothetical protein BASA62_002006 [Batrachochytrium salamandrivorans]KAH6575332.1 hypothetical protein BASA60_005081 [Batrachochytrium salamandrivorans]KAH6593977.1 hypothetical protein BASA50_006887 [Batrachochytrium salamandrivorans]KAH6602133.1 hypothetical protein BASA61_001426 [Batrachochytrium salamandrivorans]KAH9270366.1 hypothetical protein BASA83_007525 [Batrachochytrium salamandrivorans]